MTSEKPGSVSFVSSGNGFQAFVSLDRILSVRSDPEALLQEVSSIYGIRVAEMRALIAEIKLLRHQHRLLPALKIWQLGNLIFLLISEIADLSLELDRLYSHLVRDLEVNRKWLEKVIIFRRYIPRAEAIPENLNWGRCEKGTRRAAESLAQEHAAKEQRRDRPK